MRKGNIYSFFGDGRGKVSLAVGYGLRAVSENLNVIMIQFLETSNIKEREIIKKFEPDLKLFRFNKQQDNESARITMKEAEYEIKQAFNFARKVVDTGGCDVLILDGIIDAINKGFIEIEDLKDLLSKKDDYTEIAIIGKRIPEGFQENIESIIYEFTKNSAEV